MLMLLHCACSNGADFNTFVWDVNYIGNISNAMANGMSGEGVICKVPHEEPTCVSWKPDNPNELLLGTSTGTIRLFDIRAPDTSQVSLIAHTANRPRKMRVKGLRIDPFNANVLASFTDVTLEPVKVWDFRKGSNAKPRTTILPHDNPGHQNIPGMETSFVTDVAWCLDRTNVLAVATSVLPEIGFYSSLKPGTADASSNQPLRTLKLGEPCKQLKIFPSTPSNSSSKFSITKTSKFVGVTPLITAKDLDGPSTYNLMLSSISGYTGIKLRQSVGLSVGANDCAIVGVDGTWKLYSSEERASAESYQDGGVATQCLQFSAGAKVDYSCTDQVMELRCRHGYGIGSAKNIQILTDELDYIRSQPSDAKKVDIKNWAVGNIQQLIRVWNWIDRIENIDSLDVTLKTCGIRSVLGAGAQGRDSEKERSVVTGAVVFASASRCRARLTCGWAANVWMGDNSGTKLYYDVTGDADDEEGELDEDEVEEEIKEIVDGCEFSYSFERACALAVFQGDIAYAVTVLQNAVDILQNMFSEPPSGVSNVGIPRTATEDSGFRSELVNNDFKLRLSEHDDDELVMGSLLSDYPNISPEYVHMLSLVAMCIAGYNCPTVTAKATGINKAQQQATAAANSASAANTRMWTSMCQMILKQFEADIVSQRLESCYLLAACQFLLISLEDANRKSATDNNGQTFGKYSAILTNSKLSLEDRAAFAVSYLSDFELSVFIKALLEESRSSGLLEGLALTGFADEGYEIIQKYLDDTGDLQTVALLIAKQADKNSANGAGSESTSAGRIPFLQASVLSNQALPHPVSKEFMWLSEYRLLLNKWKFFFERASLDVELGREHRAKLLRQQQQQSVSRSGRGGASVHVNSGRPPGMTSSSSRTKAATASQLAMSNDRNKSSRNPFYTLPPHYDTAAHILLRCNFCSASLPADQNMPQTQQAFLKKQCPIINCCYNCKKQLPRCYVCSLYMGFVNPLHELNRLLSQRRKAAENAISNAATADAGGTGVVSNGVTGTPSGNHRDAVDAENEANVLGFGKWFFFCQLCRHGGHAGCVEDWFQNKEPGAPNNATSPVGDKESDNKANNVSKVVTRDICGVAGCTCRCLAL
jgi:hypothetical protein